VAAKRDDPASDEAGATGRRMALDLLVAGHSDPDCVAVELTRVLGLLQRERGQVSSVLLGRLIGTLVHRALYFAHGWKAADPSFNLDDHLRLFGLFSDGQAT